MLFLSISAQRVVVRRRRTVAAGSPAAVPTEVSVSRAGRAGAHSQRSRDGGRPEFIAKEIQRWLDRAPVDTLCAQKVGPWGNRCVPRFKDGSGLVMHLSVSRIEQGC